MRQGRQLASTARAGSCALFTRRPGSCADQNSGPRLWSGCQRCRVRQEVCFSFRRRCLGLFARCWAFSAQHPWPYLHRKQDDTPPTRRWWQSTGGSTSVSVSSVVEYGCASPGLLLLSWSVCSSSVANGTRKYSSQGSDSNSSASSPSSGTPVSSLSGLSQVMFPPSLPFASDMVDVCISTEDQRSVEKSQEETSRKLMTAAPTHVSPVCPGLTASGPRPPSRRTTCLRGQVQTPPAAWDRQHCSETRQSGGGGSPPRRPFCWPSAGPADPSAGPRAK